MGGSFWMFGAKMTETNGNKLFFLGIQRQRLAPKVRPWFWTRIRLGKAVAGPGVRGQDDRDKWKQTCFFLGIQRQRLAPKVRPWEARFGPELDWEKLWRDQVFGAKMTETNGNKLLVF